MAESVHVTLTGHAANPARFHQHIDVSVARAAEGGMVLNYRIHGLNLDLHVPTPHAPAPANELWRTTCCELFIGPASQTDYREFNFSPSGQWTSYDFHDYRQNAEVTRNLPAPALRSQRSEDLLELEATLPHAALPDSPRLHLALAVILASNEGHIGYWALVHPPGKPDFHNRRGFALHLDERGFHS